MAAKFTKGDSIKTTHTLTPAKRVAAEPAARNHQGMRTDNTMTGMPKAISTGASGSRAGMASGSGAGPHREGPIGRRGSSGPFPKTAKGTIAGKMESLKGRAKTKSEGSRRRSTMY